MPKVREVIRRLTDEGWYLHRQRGSHRQYKHPHRPGSLVTVAGKPSHDLPTGTWKSIQKQAGWTED
jgi:predicted RNA binding protein YcfA (HicA-like mRNA interferase family)